ncbi:hypothetical protein [Herbaspirillum sp. SJZ107]|uniref:hypothetical protein n=1 Tax=Herbaspirillum sp. SJZ107 TaxID=2572881 RepID=UPI00114F54A8|nr:hypothetical protein [Herbaspirillum sp. SJZ107]TQK10245.1 hypothetical protein FBX97_0161 [Herbaspirillum sp. SJZ107]
MIHLTMTPETFSVRAYDRPDGYEKRLPYRAIVQVKSLDGKVAHLGGAIGTVDRETWGALLVLLREKGFTAVMLERHKKIKTITLGSADADPVTES